MRVRSLLALAGLLATVLTASPALAAPDSDPSGAVIGGHYGHGAGGPGSYAVLIDVHEINQDRGKGGGKPAAKANCSNDKSSTAPTGFAKTGWTLTNTTARLNTATVPAHLGDVTDELQASWSAWSGAPNVTQTTGSTVTRYTANRGNDVLWGSTGGSLATTYTWRWNDGMVESDVVFNKGIAWAHVADTQDGCDENAGAVYDVANIATHEFGHAYGLDHPADGRWETMYAYGYSGETLKRTPDSGDLAGIADLY